MKCSVTIMLASYNGQKYISDQINSIINQYYEDWSLVVSDDGSTDRTVNIVDSYICKWPEGKLSIRRGPRGGFCRNFLSMACDTNLMSDYYAFSDQDDLWDPQKLSRALEWLANVPNNVPALYCGRTLSIDNEGNHLGLSPHFRVPPNFRNALVQSIAGGNTMVFNEAARQLLIAVGDNVEVPSHDWWLYILVTGAGGVVKYDPTPMLYYRQHEGNLVGANSNLRARWSRVVQLFQGRLRAWNELHLRELEKVGYLLTVEHQQLLEKFLKLRNDNVLRRVVSFVKSGIHRQTILGHLGLLTAVIFKKV